MFDDNLAGNGVCFLFSVAEECEWNGWNGMGAVGGGNMRTRRPSASCRWTVSTLLILLYQIVDVGGDDN